MSKKKQKLSKTVADAFDLPREVIMDIPKISMVGNQQITIENHRGIIQYSDEKMRICITGGELIILGKNLIVDSIVPEEIKIYGKINNVMFDLF